MEKIVHLLNEKNHYLEKFYSLNEKELVNFAQGDFENLNDFYNTREKILEVIQYIDNQIDHLSATTDQTMDTSLKGQVSEALRIKEEYVNQILEQDLQVLSCIETAKNQIIRELQEVNRSRKAVKGYKMPTFDLKLNEEV